MRFKKVPFCRVNGNITQLLGKSGIKLVENRYDPFQFVGRFKRDDDLSLSFVVHAELDLGIEKSAQLILQ